MRVALAERWRRRAAFEVRRARVMAATPDSMVQGRYVPPTPPKLADLEDGLPVTVYGSDLHGLVDNLDPSTAYTLHPDGSITPLVR